MVEAMHQSTLLYEVTDILVGILDLSFYVCIGGVGNICERLNGICVCVC